MSDFEECSRWPLRSHEGPDLHYRIKYSTTTSMLFPDCESLSEVSQPPWKCQSSFFLLLLELQPSIGFSLFTDSFNPLITQSSPSSYPPYSSGPPQHPFCLFLGLPLDHHLPTDLQSKIFLGILCCSILIVCPSQAVLVQFINLTISVLLY